jgi:hypothetical protein
VNRGEWTEEVNLVLTVCRVEKGACNCHHFNILFFPGHLQEDEKVLELQLSMGNQWSKVNIYRHTFNIFSTFEGYDIT